MGDHKNGTQLSPTPVVQGKSEPKNAAENGPNNNNNNNNKHNVPCKEDLWKGAEIKTLADNKGWIVEMTGLDSKMHTVYARAVQTADYKPSEHPSPLVRDVVDSVVDVAWKHVAKQILQGHDKDEILRVDMDHWNQGAFPPANQLLELGAVWLVNETSFLQHQADPHANGKKKGHHHHNHTKKKRLTCHKDGDRNPDWKDYVLRVHYAPSRFHAMEEVDWAKYCRGLLLGDDSVQIFIGDKMVAAHEHIPASGYPDKKDGAIVYEDADHGFAILNKPGTVPDHATVNNHAEDVLTVFAHVLKEREEETRKEPKGQDHSNDPVYKHIHHRSAHLNLPLPLDTETQGLVIISTKRPFASYLTSMVEHPPSHAKGGGVVKKYKCLVCVKKPEDMMSLNNLLESGKVVKHYYHHNPNHKDHNNFVKEIPKNQHPHEYGACEIRLLKIGTNHGLYAANVTADPTVGDVRLAQRLWGLGVQNHSKTLAEDLGVVYVAQLELEQIVDAEQLHTHLNKASRLTPQQLIIGTMGALGFPLVGDTVHGGGTSEVWGHRHGWNRLALQCCEWSFPQPQWNTPKDGDEKAVEKKAPCEEKKEEKTAPVTDKEAEGWKTVSNEKKAHVHGRHGADHGKEAQNDKTKKHYLVPKADERCVFRLNEAWWNPLLDQYHVDGF